MSAPDSKENPGNKSAAEADKPRKKPEPVYETGHAPPLRPNILDQEINQQRRKLAQMKEEPQKCRLLKKERENWDIGRDLDAMRTATRERLAQCKVKREAFDKRQLELQNIVRNNESFIRDTDIKIERAERKAREEQQSCKKADEEYISLAGDLQRLRTEKEKEIDNIRYHMHYKQFLAATAAIYNSEKTSRWPKGEAHGEAAALEGGNPEGTGTAFITQAKPNS